MNLARLIAVLSIRWNLALVPVWLRGLIFPRSVNISRS